ncbi:sensor histidine kinase [Archangium sp.]|jgi:signal transduction histidine kinase|uniref:sensor histidine kinase n=1 Tax=Archangium sp. TaxID=1872627 RepID=UPI002EDAAAC0
MTVRFKVVLFAAVAVGLVALIGGTLFHHSTRGRLSMELVLGTQEKTEGYGQLVEGAVLFQRELIHAYEVGGDAQAVLQEHERRAGEAFSRLRELLARERELTGSERTAGKEERLARLERTYRHWLEQATASASGTSEGAELRLLHGSFATFERDVEPLLKQEREAERAELAEHKRIRFSAFQRQRLLGVVLPLVALGLMLTLAVSILLPLHRSMREMLKAAERIGRGDFEHAMSAERADEFGTQARAFNRMATELRDTVLEKQRLVREQAEASEREVRRYNTLLEETVRQRTCELEQANARLVDSLRQLQTTQEQLLFSDRLATIGRLAAGVGHEINNPLAFILSNLNYVQKEMARLDGGTASKEERQELQDALAEAREGAERVRSIVQDLKMLSHPDSMEKRPVDLGQVLRSAAKMAAHEIRDRARLVEAWEDVPPIDGNSARLCQVFLNLLINAAQAIPPGQAERHEIRLTTRQGEDPGRLLVEVSDTGSGIPPEHLEHIFEPFFTTKPVGVGTGLGLSVCHSIITAHGGKISVESTPGQGTTFRVSLPRTQSA